MSDLNRPLLQELLSAYGPVGQEDAVRAICRRELEPLVDAIWQDEAGNLVGVLRGGDPDADPTRVMAHMDELSMLVKRVEVGMSNPDRRFGPDHPVPAADRRPAARPPSRDAASCQRC